MLSPSHSIRAYDTDYRSHGCIEITGYCGFNFDSIYSNHSYAFWEIYLESVFERYVAD